ncbi:MAG: diguanylate cyclase [Oscillospiraceae bacterium]|jgi:diguanylate cyclase (GGDEF)-like protein|nr:diguanylate cyclase [Oscillospiraceae bacterium]
MSEKKEFTVLTTDDEKSNLDILAGILSPYYNILVAKSGARTLELAKEKKPDLILLDVMMPEMTGFEVITALKASNDTANIPVIFITGLSSTEDEQRGFFLGAVDYITKPFNNAIVKARVKTHMRIVDQMRTIERIGLIDPLTKIANRRGFEDRFEAEWGRAIRENIPISFLIMDIDLFKIYNDTYGHQQGDVALQAFADTTIDSLHRAADFVARWGGEEFVVLLPDTGIEGAMEIAERIRVNIEEMTIPIDEDTQTSVTVSIGINCVVPELDTPMKEFFEKADLALYKAKELGRNRIVKAEDL